MKKIFLSLIALTATLQFSYAQWTTGTGTIFPLTLTDKVGIGHNSPATLLHVLGTSEQLRLGYNTSNYVSLTTNSSGALTFTRNGTAASTKSVAFSGTNGELAVISNNTSGSAFYVRGNGTADIVKVLDGTNPVLTVRDGGNVGIGTAVPTDNLHVVSTNGGISVSNTGHYGLRLYNLGDNTEKMHLFWRSSDDVIALNTGASPGRDLSFITGVAESIRIKASGNVGIGTSTPQGLLHVNGVSVLAGSNSNIDPALKNLNFLQNTGQLVIGWNRSGAGGETNFISNQGAGDVGGFSFTNHDNNNAEKQLMWIRGNGQVLIGDTQGKFGNHKLAVGGSAIATSMTVKLVDNWPDFVFLKNYKLPTLAEIKSFVDKNHHLPDMPSSEEIYANGLDLGEMNRLLLKKVEELTLYLIEKDEKLKQQEDRLKKLEDLLLKKDNN